MLLLLSLLLLLSRGRVLRHTVVLLLLSLLLLLSRGRVLRHTVVLLLLSLLLLLSRGHSIEMLINTDGSKLKFHFFDRDFDL